MAANDSFACFAALQKAGPCVPWKYTPRPLGDHDVEIKISHCGVCHSDIHTIDSGWHPPTKYPLVPGHEIIGTVAAKGVAVTALAVGDRVGLGPQCFACFQPDCDACSIGQDCCCPRAVYTYDDKYPDGSPTYGGYAESVRAHDSLVVKIPPALPSDATAPLLCAGITVWAPLVEFGAKAGVKVGVVGLGGLGHLAVQYASKLGAEVTVISQSDRKKADAARFGAAHYISSSDAEQMRAAARRFNLLIVCGAGNGMDWSAYISLLKPLGKLVLVGLPEEEVHFLPQVIVNGKTSVVGSKLAPRTQIEAMLEFSAKHNVLPLIEKVPMEKVNEAIARVRKGEVRYRYVLENTKHA